MTVAVYEKSCEGHRYVETDKQTNQKVHVRFDFTWCVKTNASSKEI